MRCADTSLSSTVFLCVCLGLGLVDKVDPTETVEQYLVRGLAELVPTDGQHSISAGELKQGVSNTSKQLSEPNSVTFATLGADLTPWHSQGSFRQNHTVIFLRFKGQ